MHTTNMLIIRVTTLVLTLMNAIIVAFASTGFADMLWYKVMSVVFLVASAAWNCWENNDFTSLAKLATSIYDKVKDGTLDREEVEDLLEKAELDAE